MRQAPLAFVLASLLSALAPASPAAAADPILPLTEVQPGMQCTGLSVVRATTISSFRIEVIDVVSRGGAAGPRILVRASGPPVDQTGLGPGFSGSPIYCPGPDGASRNIGAISEGVGDYGNDVALATPIEQIIGEPVSRPAARTSGARVAGRRWATPLTFSGLTARMRTRVTRAARRAERPVYAAPPGVASGFATQDLRPGASMATSLATGDLGLSAIGTVTYRDGASVWGFGHPLDGSGRRSLLLQDAYVHTVIGNPLGLPEASSYKLASPGHTVGTLTYDAANGVAGQLGSPPRTTAVRISVRDLSSGRLGSVSSDVADERRLELGDGVQTVGAIGLGEALIEAFGAAPPRMSGRACMRIEVSQLRKPLRFCNRYFSASALEADVTKALGQVSSFVQGPLTVRRISIRARVRPSLDQAYLVRVRAPRRARPGKVIPLRLTLRQRRGGLQRRTARLRIPTSTRPGRRSIRLTGVSDSPDSEATAVADLAELIAGLGGEAESAGAPSLRALARRIAAIEQPTGLRAGLAQRGKRRSRKPSGSGKIVLGSSKQLISGSASAPIRIGTARR